MNESIRTLRSALLAAATMVIIAAGDGAAQTHTTAGGYGGGFLMLGRLNPGAQGTSLAMDAGWVVTAFGETWHEAVGRIGTRLNGAFSQRPLQIGGEARDINTWMLDASVLLRLLPPQEGGVVAPFLSAGAGLIHYGLRTGPPVQYLEEGVLYQGNNQRQIAVVGGAGIDVLPGGFLLFGNPLGIRLEAADHVALRSPFETIEGERLGPIHNFRFGVSLIGLGWF